jgi:hypothetical protein
MAKGDIDKLNAKLTREQRIERAKRAGEKSGLVRGQRKTAREFAEAALNAEVTDKSTGKKVVVKDAIIQGVVAKAIQEKDLAAIKYLFELTGENPAQRMEITGAEGKDLIPQRPLTREELKELHRKLEEE